MSRLSKFRRDFPYRVINPSDSYEKESRMMTQGKGTQQWVQGDHVATLAEVLTWCRTNCQGEYRVWTGHARFASQRDAVLFKLFWG